MKFLAALIPSLLSGLRSLIGQLLVALGITAVTYQGMEHLLANFKQQITANMTGLPNDLLQLFYLSGGGVALNIILGGLTFYVAMSGVSKLTSKVGKKG